MGHWEAVTYCRAVAYTTRINILPKNRRPGEERGGRWREALQRVINKSLISRAFSPPSFPHPAQHTRLSADAHPWMPAGLLSLYSPGLGGDWFVATAPGLSDTVTAAIQSHGIVRLVEAPAHTQKYMLHLISPTLGRKTDRINHACAYRQWRDLSQRRQQEGVETHDYCWLKMMHNYLTKPAKNLSVWMFIPISRLWRKPLSVIISWHDMTWHVGVCFTSTYETSCTGIGGNKHFRW